MTFTSRYDSDGTGKFMVGDIARIVYLTEADYNAVAQLLNEAYSLGRGDGLYRKPWAVTPLDQQATDLLTSPSFLGDRDAQGKAK